MVASSSADHAPGGGIDEAFEAILVGGTRGWGGGSLRDGGNREESCAADTRKSVLAIGIGGYYHAATNPSRFAD